jgi:hypothetical protein
VRGGVAPRKVLLLVASAASNGKHQAHTSGKFSKSSDTIGYGIGFEMFWGIKMIDDKDTGVF